MAENPSKLDQIRNLREARALAVERVDNEKKVEPVGDKISPTSKKVSQTGAA